MSRPLLAPGFVAVLLSASFASAAERLPLKLGAVGTSCTKESALHRSASATPLWGSSVKWNSGESSFLESSDRSGMRLCLSCHDGATADGGDSYLVVSESAIAPHRPSMSDSHPVGMDYMAAYARRPGKYNHPGGNPDIRLEEGKVTCLSCHSRPEEGSVVGRSKGRTVCLACHIQ